MRILGIDYGEKRVGVAVSDTLEITAHGLETVHRQNKKQLIADLAQLCKKEGVEEVVIGLPINMNGTQGPKAKEVLDFLPELQKAVGVPVKTWDERLSSRQAGRLMIEEGLSRKRQKQESDRLAATLILQGYLEFRRSSKRV